MNSKIITRVALVSCVKKKRASASPAGKLYLSSLFRAMRSYAEANSDVWYILSAKYGLLNPKKVIEPYDRTLMAMTKNERISWAEQVQKQLLDILPSAAEVTILAGLRYREDLEPFLRKEGFPVSVPMKGLKIGEQLRWLKDACR